MASHVVTLRALFVIGLFTLPMTFCAPTMTSGHNSTGAVRHRPLVRRMKGPSTHLRKHLAQEAVVVNASVNGVSLWDGLNAMIEKGQNGVYTGGKGVIVRMPFDGLSSTVVPATFLVNDMVIPSVVYPSSGGGGGGGNPECPSYGNTGYGQGPNCNEGPWDYAQVGAVVGSAMSTLMLKFDEIQSSTWGWGVFYASDSNSVDQRCRYLQSDNGYDCPGGWIPMNGGFQPDSSKKGSGNYPAGNPYANGQWGGGTGCHFSKYGANAIDQTDATNGQGMNIVQDYDCQCNYNMKGNGWDDWVQTWLAHATPKPGFEWQGWFGDGKAPSFALDFAACWVNNPRDMVELQNALWRRNEQWSNQMLPKSNWNSGDGPSMRPYWGWNEVPVNGKQIDDPKNWDAIYFKLPAAICGGGGKSDSVHCLSSGAQQQLEWDIDKYVQQNTLVPGADNIYKRPGSAVLFLNDELRGHDTWGSVQFQRRFACENWTSPGNKYKIIMDTTAGTCHIEKLQLK